MTQTQTAIVTAGSTVPSKSTEAKYLEFIPFGTQDKIRLSIALVQKYLAVPTKTGRTCTERDAMKFMMLCQAKGLNPWEGDAYLVGYDTHTPNGVVANFSLITAHQAFLKRAELHPEFDGMKSGIILLGDDGVTLTDREGDFHLDSEQVVGGWATVFFKTRKVPMTQRLRVSRFNTGFAEWKKDPAGMICKCAESAALRSAFPTKLGGMYSREEQTPIEINSALVESAAAADIKLPEPPQLPATTDGRNIGPDEPTQQEQRVTHEQSPATPGKQPESKFSAQEDLGDFVIRECGCTFDDFRTWAMSTGNLAEADAIGAFAEVKSEDCKRLLRAKSGLKTGLQQAKAQRLSPPPGQ